MDHLKGIIKDNKVVVFGKANCTYTKKARQALVDGGLEAGCIHYFDLEKEADCKGLTNQYIKVLGSWTGAGATVPKVFIGGFFVGGGDETVAAAESGKVRDMAEEAGVKCKNVCNKKTHADGYADRHSKHVENNNFGAADGHLNRNHNKSATHNGAHVQSSGRQGKTGKVH